MRKRIFGRRFKRDTNERKALFRSLMHGLVLHGKIKTTEAKAKAIQAAVEKLVTAAKNDGEKALRLITARLANEKVAQKIVSEIAPLFVQRSGGYTRIIKMGPRVKDGARMVLMTWVEEVSVTNLKEPKRNIKPKTENIKQKPESSKKETKVKVSKKTTNK